MRIPPDRYVLPDDWLAKLVNRTQQVCLEQDVLEASIKQDYKDKRAKFKREYWKKKLEAV